MQTSRLHEAVRQFEALVTRQLVRETQTEEGDAIYGMAQEELAASIAASGGLGFAKLLEKALSQTCARGSTSSPDSSQLK